MIEEGSGRGQWESVDEQQQKRGGWTVRHDRPPISMDVLLRDVDTCYSNIEVAMRRNEVDQVRTLFSVRGYDWSQDI